MGPSTFYSLSRAREQVVFSFPSAIATPPPNNRVHSDCTSTCSIPIPAASGFPSLPFPSHHRLTAQLPQPTTAGCWTLGEEMTLSISLENEAGAARVRVGGAEWYRCRLYTAILLHHACPTSQAAAVRAVSRTSQTRLLVPPRKQQASKIFRRNTAWVHMLP